MNINLNEIYDEITIGYQQNDDRSLKLKKYVSQVRQVLEDNVKNEKFNFFDDSDSNVFLQGSYATNTAIKNKRDSVDADLGIIFSEEIERERVLNILKENFPDKRIELKKPCIYIEFDDEYSVDIAIYRAISKDIFHLNSISSCGEENLDKVKPKEFIRYASDQLVDSEKISIKRQLVRLTKYFIKNSTVHLKIQEDNKIPSIAVLLHAIDYNPAQSSLEQELNNFIVSFRDLLRANKYYYCNEAFLIGNVFHKVKNTDDIDAVLDLISLCVSQKDYAQICDEKFINKIVYRNKENATPAPVGTLG